MAEKRCPECDRLEPEGSYRCSCGFVFREEPVAVNELTAAKVRTIVVVFLALVAFGYGLSIYTQAVSSIGAAALAFMAASVVLPSFRRLGGAGFGCLGCILMFLGFIAVSWVHPRPRRIVKNVPRYTSKSPLLVGEAHLGQPMSNLAKTWNQQLTANGQVTRETADGPVVVTLKQGLVISVRGYQLSQLQNSTMKTLIKKGDSRELLEKVFEGRYRSLADELRLTCGKKDAVNVKLSYGKVNEVFLFRNGLGTPELYSIDGVSLRMYTEFAIDEWGGGRRGAKKGSYLYGDTDEDLRAFQVLFDRVDGIYGRNLTLGNGQKLTVGDSRERVLEVFPGCRPVEDSILEAPNKIWVRFDDDDAVCGFATGSLRDLAYPSVIPTAIAKRFQLSLKWRGPMSLAFSRNSVHEVWHGEVRAESARLNEQSPLPEHLQAAKKAGGHVRIDSETKAVVGPSILPVGELSAWLEGGTHHYIEFRTADRVYGISSLDRDLAYALAQAIVESRK